MADEMSDRYMLPYIQPAQAQKEMTHNEALALVDALLHAQAESATIAIAPPGAVPGRSWIVGPGASGEWAGRDGELACLTSGGWRFVAPRAGMRVAVSDEASIHVHNGVGWTVDPVHADGYYVAGDKIIGARQGAIADPAGGGTIDGQARTAIIEILSILRNHGLIASS